MKLGTSGSFALLAVLLASCGPRGNRENLGPGTHGAFHILAGSELKDIETNLGADIRNATGLDLAFTYAGTLDTLERLKAGEQYDALWVSHGKYLAMDDALKGKILAQEKTMLSPVLLGLKTSKARALGWDHQDPTWKEIADAANAGKFTFGMTNPASSNSGLTATIGLAAALASNPEAMTEADLRNPRLVEFFHGQSLTSGSSGWLAEAYERDQSRVDGLINYESVLLSLNASGKLSEPLTLVYPKEGIITADYPLMLLNAQRRADYDKLVAYLRGKDFQTRMSATTLRRPVNPDATVAAAIPQRTLVELPFPAQQSLISALIDTFLSDVRVPSDSRYVLDLSGSMDGERIASLKEAMNMLASDDRSGSNRYARFQNREQIGIIPFASTTYPTTQFTMGSTPESNARTRAAVRSAVASFTADGGTDIYGSVRQAIIELVRDRSAAKSKRYYTVVLMTDGENNRDINSDEFRQWYLGEGDKVRGIPVFPILFGEGSARDLRMLAELTGGRMFDSRATALPVVFKEIRGYQ